VSSSVNAPAVLDAAGLSDRFDAVVSGAVATELKLPGKPAPDTFLHAAEVLGATAAESVVLEDAVSGVRAGAAGDFGAVIGVDRGAGPDALTAAGATVVVRDLAELLPAQEGDA
jgi:beta-phosphoglucomutase-like phosphatase (HAD superfamily)